MDLSEFYGPLNLPDSYYDCLQNVNQLIGELWHVHRFVGFTGVMPKLPVYWDYYYRWLDRLDAVATVDEFVSFETWTMDEHNLFERVLNDILTQFIFCHHLTACRQSRIASLLDALTKFKEINREKIDAKKRHLPGLTPDRIRQFRHFNAGHDLRGEVCAVCLNEWEIDIPLIELDCPGRHNFCQGCIEGWLRGHRTCPLCLHNFA